MNFEDLKIKFKTSSIQNLALMFSVSMSQVNESKLNMPMYKPSLRYAKVQTQTQDMPKCQDRALESMK